MSNLRIRKMQAQYDISERLPLLVRTKKNDFL